MNPTFLTRFKETFISLSNDLKTLLMIRAVQMQSVATLKTVLHKEADSKTSKVHEKLTATWNELTSLVVTMIEEGEADAQELSALNEELKEKMQALAQTQVGEQLELPLEEGLHD